MKKNGSPTFFEKLLIKTGRRYPLIVLLVTQFVNTLLTILLVAMPAQENAEFSKSQGINLLFFGAVALLVRNLIIIAYFHHSNNAMLERLSLPTQAKQTDKAANQDEKAWVQATSASKNFLYVQILGLIFIAYIPTSLFGYFRLDVTLEQLAHLGFATLAAGITNFLIESLLLDQFFEPIIQALIPRHFDAQLAGMKGMRLRLKLALAFIGLVLIALLLITPSAYQQLKHTAQENSEAAHFVEEALPKIIKAGIGALVVGTFLSIQLTSYFSGQFQKMISMFTEIEAGDLSRRSKVSSPDEFGTLNIYLNHMIERIQVLNATLEDQVIERTAKLNQTNDLLQTELAERKRMEEQLKHTALHDPLTDLPNRILFMDRLNLVMKRRERNKVFSFAVIFMDLDRFKVVNDSLGHNVGDLLLIECGKRLAASVRDGDTIARLGGDEFVIFN